MEAVRKLKIGQLHISIYASNQALGEAAAREAHAFLQATLTTRGSANVILATGNSQLSTLEALRSQQDLPWDRIRFFHMDEYIGIDPAHPAGFACFLHRHFIDRLPVATAGFHPLPILDDPGDAQAVEKACQEYTALLKNYPADLCLMGIGENGHIAFNDPPYARFDDPAWVKLVQLASRSRRQQVSEGHFHSLDETPTHALTLTIPALLAPRRLLVIVPEQRKAEAVQAALYGPISENLPASILRRQAHARLYLDRESASLLDRASPISG